MRRLILFLLGLLLFVLLPIASPAQISKRLEGRAPNPALDGRTNNPAIPDVIAIPSQFRSVIVLRFKYNTDLLAGLKAAVERLGIQDAVILAAVGSVRNYQVHAVANRDLPSKDLFVRDPSAPADIVGMNGYVLNGRVHPHITLSTGDRAFGGHLEPGTSVYTFALLTIGVLDTNADFSRFDDQTYR
jgi:uncharacterized protein